MLECIHIYQNLCVDSLDIRSLSLLYPPCCPSFHPDDNPFHFPSWEQRPFLKWSWFIEGGTEIRWRSVAFSSAGESISAGGSHSKAQFLNSPPSVKKRQFEGSRGMGDPRLEFRTFSSGAYSSEISSACFWLSIEFPITYELCKHLILRPEALFTYF